MFTNILYLSRKYSPETAKNRISCEQLLGKISRRLKIVQPYEGQLDYRPLV